ATATSKDNNTSEMGRPREPVLFVPGIGGVAPRIDLWKSWYLDRSFDPANLRIEPLNNTYYDLLKTLQNSGYVLNDPNTPGSNGTSNLYAAVYDWRMPPGPTDGTIDGHIDIENANGTKFPLTAARIIADASAGTYFWGVDYLGYWMLQATLAWNK